MGSTSYYGFSDFPRATQEYDRFHENDYLFTLSYIVMTIGMNENCTRVNARVAQRWRKPDS